MLIKCPECGQATQRLRVSRSLYSPCVLVALGGPTAALIFECSRKQQLRCGRCGALFAKHTVRSRIFQLSWLWFLLSLVGFVILLLAGYVVF